MPGSPFLSDALTIRGMCLLFPQRPSQLFLKAFLMAWLEVPDTPTLSAVRVAPTCSVSPGARKQLWETQLQKEPHPCQSAQAGGTSNPSLFSHRSRGWRPKVTAAGLLPQDPSPWPAGGYLPRHPHRSMCVYLSQPPPHMRTPVRLGHRPLT